MKVLHIIPSVASRDGGPSEAVIQLCRSLTQQGVEVDLAYTTAPSEEAEFRESARAMVSDDFHVAEFPRLGGGGYKYARRFSQWIASKVSLYDLVHVHAVFSHTSIAGARAARRRGIPYILRPLGTLSQYGLSRKPILKRAFLALGVRRLIADAEAIHCTSAGEEQDLRRAFAVRRAFVLPNGVDDALFHLRLPQNRKAVVFLGRFHRKKNVDLLIRAFAQVRPRGWRLVIAGDGDRRYTRDLHSLAESLKVDVTFSGWLAPDQKRSLLASAGLFVLPSSDENFGIAVAEAMAAAVPVIVTPHVGLAGTVRQFDAGWLADADHDRLAVLLCEATSNDELMQSKGRHGREAAKQLFRWAHIGRELEAVYGNLVASQ